MQLAAYELRENVPLLFGSKRENRRRIRVWRGADYLGSYGSLQEAALMAQIDADREARRARD